MNPSSNDFDKNTEPCFRNMIIISARYQQRHIQGGTQRNTSSSDILYEDAKKTVHDRPNEPLCATIEENAFPDAFPPCSTKLFLLAGGLRLSGSTMLFLKPMANELLPPSKCSRYCFIIFCNVPCLEPDILSQMFQQQQVLMPKWR